MKITINRIGFRRNEKHEVNMKLAANGFLWGTLVPRRMRYLERGERKSAVNELSKTRKVFLQGKKEEGLFFCPTMNISVNFPLVRH